MIETSGITKSKIYRVEGVMPRLEQDTLAIEEPLEIRLEYGPAHQRTKRSISITMRTPGHDFELAAGFLFTEGIVQEPRQIEKIRFCGANHEKDSQTNIVRVELREDVEIDIERLSRHFYTNSSCGVCGKSSIEALKTQSPFQTTSSRQSSVSPEFIHRLPELLRKSQGLFDSTGGIHASAFFSLEGKLITLREDVGRHNALDKLIGHAFLERQLPLRQSVLLVSGRASFELVQKASMAGISTFAAVGAPSSLAVELAQDVGMTLVGFVRNSRFNIYAHPERIQIQRGQS